MQLQVAPDVSAGLPPIKVRGAIGVHGPAVTGTHGIGVSTPSALAVAAATVGFAMLEHMPNGGMFTTGIESAMAAAGRPSIMTRATGSTTSVDGANPNEHCRFAPMTAF
jgi:hypothetical protein